MTDFVDDLLGKAPFHLDAEGRAWVRTTLAEMDEAARLRHLFIHIFRGNDRSEIARLQQLAPAGVTRFFSADPAAELDLLEALHAAATIPLLVSADLEGSRMSLPFGTEVPNPLALAAVDDTDSTAWVSALTAREARAAGVNWSFTPVLDINAAFRSPIVATRGFGSDPDRIRRHARAHVAALQANGVAATAKHWPGEGHDDRDQHLLTTVIPLSVADWRATHGALYADLIADGVLSVMSAHIAFPAYMAEKHPNPGREAWRPASINRTLNQTLLREEMGFNGVIVSDATVMAGLGDWARRDDTLPEIIENGCDLILFSDEPEADIARLEAALADGRLTRPRVEEALVRVLGLKAALGLHRPFRRADRSSLGRAEDRATARAITARAPTLVKDKRGTLPLSPQRHRRVLIYSTGIVLPMPGMGAGFAFPRMLEAEGFEVTLFDPALQPDPRSFDLVIYMMGEETLLTRGRIFLDWGRLAGGMHGAMKRVWHEVPTLILSLGYPYYLYDAPAAPCVVNAYATMDSMQQAALDCLLGRAPFLGQSPVDPFCGLPEARF
jgi:beta-N-acetylhexosaminidase